MLIFIICKCYQYNTINLTKKEIEKDLKDSGDMGCKKIDHPDFQYARNSLCGACDSLVYYATGYTKNHMLKWVMNQIAKELQAKV